MSKSKKLLALALAGLALPGCITTKVFESSFVARKDAKFDPSFTPEKSNLMPESVGKACKHYVAFLGGWSEGELQDAYDQALAGHPRALGLANLQVDDEVLFTFLYNRRCKQVRGQAVLAKAH